MIKEPIFQKMDDLLEKCSREVRQACCKPELLEAEKHMQERAAALDVNLKEVDILI